MTAGRFWSLLLLLTLLGAAIRYPALHGDLWMDEIWSFRIALSEKSILGLLLNQTWANNHLLNTLWLRGLGESTPEFWFRLPSFVCGTLCIPLAAWVLRRWGRGQGTALLGAAFVTLSFFQIQFATEARGYAGAFVCALVALGLRFGQNSRGVMRWLAPIGFGVAQVIGMLWHPGYVIFAVALGMAQAAGLVVGGGERTAIPWKRRVAELFTWQTLPGGALVAYQLLFLSKLRFGAAGYQEPVAPFLEAAAWTMNLAWTKWGGPLALVLMLAAFTLGLAWSWRGRQRELAIALILACLALPLAMVFLHPPRVTSNPALLVLFPRYFHLPLGIMLLPMAWGVCGFPRGRWIGGAVLVAVLCLGLRFLLPPFYHFGRIGCREVLMHLAGKEDGTVRVGTNELTRGLWQFGFYARRMGIEGRFVWVPASEWLLTPPEYIVALAPGALPDLIPPPAIRSEGREIPYELDKVFPYAGASGFNCVVFQRKWFGGQRQEP